MQRTQYYDKNGNKPPESEWLIHEARKRFGYVPFNLESLKAHIAWREEEKGRDSSTYGKYAQDKNCLCRMLDRMDYSLDGPIRQYLSGYTATCSTGRIFQIGGCLQTCTRDMKQAAYEGLGIEITNYDIKSSQPHILLLEFDKYGIDTSWVHEYLSNDANKAEYADFCGIHKDAWKKCLLATMLGASLPTRASRVSSNSILEEICKDLGGEEDPMWEAVDLFNELVKPLHECIDTYSECLYDEIREQTTSDRNGVYQMNACGKKLYLNDLPRRKHENRSKLIAFRLQGIESAYIHWLTILSDHYGYTTLTNEHDGLVTIGEIPDVAQEMARRESGFLNARIEPKSFTDEKRPSCEPAINDYANEPVGYTESV